MARNIDSELKKLGRVPSPVADESAKARAADAAMRAFDAARQQDSEKFQGFDPAARLTDILNTIKGMSLMQMRIPLAAAATGLLFVPLAFHLYSTTAIQPVALPQPVQLPQVLPDDGTLDQLGGATGEASADRDFELDDTRVAVNEAPREETEMAPAPAVPPRAMAKTEDRVTAEQFADPAPVPEALTSTAQSVAAPRQERAGGLASADANELLAPVSSAEPGRARLQTLYEGGDEFAAFEEAETILTAENPVSTFSVDVDTASYAFTRRALENGYLPPPDAVRVEELVNYFDYGYAAPEDPAAPFEPTVSVYPTPWNEDTRLVQIGIRAMEPEEGTTGPANLVFLIDTSGSMDAPDKLPLLKRAFGLLLDQLGPEDRVSIVTYAGSAGTVLQPTPADRKGEILAALNHLQPGGSTAGAAGIEEAYWLAQSAAGEGTNNRVILATDGDFNVGISDPEDLKRFIERKRKQNISLSVLGFGEGNYKDDLMQSLAQNGNGNAAYIDSFREAQKVLQTEVRGTLQTVASDVKVQIEFNPATVAEYRLIGYETRALRRQDFNNDRIDAGDVGAGHTVTALYEITPAGAGSATNEPLRYGDDRAAPEPEATPDDLSEFGFLKLRYKLPGENESRLIEQPIATASALDSLSAAGPDMRFAAAVAAFGQKLRLSQALDTMSWDDIRALADGARGIDPEGYRAEFVSLVGLARSLAAD